MTTDLIYSLLLSLCGIVFGNGPEKVAKNFFQVNENIQEVETLAVSCAREYKSVLGRAKEWAPSLKRNVCTCSPHEKIAFCEDVVRTDHYGLEFDIRNYRESSCKTENFFVSRITVPPSSIFKLPMFACPRIFYTDLDTNEQKLARFVYRVSKAKSRKEALVYFQEYESSSLYPRQHVLRISFKALRARKKERMVPAAVQPMYARSLRPMIENEIVHYLRAKQFLAVYTKFVMLFHSLNICGMNRSQKVYLCKQNVKEHLNVEELDAANYHEENCRRHRLHFEYKTTENFNFKNKLNLLSCPRAVSASMSGEQQLIPIFYYLASNKEPRSVMIFSRINEKGEKLRPRCTIHNLYIKSIVQARAREKLFPHPYHKRRQTKRARSFEKMEKEINGKRGVVQMPITIARDHQLISEQIRGALISSALIREQQLIDYFLMTFSQIKKYKLVYERFRKTYWSLDICPLSGLQKKALCDKVLAEYEYGLEPNPLYTEIDYSCRKQTVKLVLREVEYLETDIFALWECPPSLNDPNRVYFIGKTYLRDSALLYKSTSHERLSFPANIYPEALFKKINRQLLARIENESQLQPATTGETSLIKTAD